MKRITGPADTASFIPVTKAMCCHFRAEIKRTGVTAMTLLKTCDNLPEGLTVSVVNRWLGRVEKLADPHHVAFVTERWAAMPDGEQTGAGRGPGRKWSNALYIPLTDAMVALIHDEMVRSGHDYEMLAGASLAPDGITPRIIRGWVRRHAKRARLDHWEFVAGMLASLPDRTAPLPPLTRRPFDREPTA